MVTEVTTVAARTSDTFFCHACLEDRPATDASPDPRYCKDCYNFLLKEAESLGPGKHPAWVPKAPDRKRHYKNAIKVSEVGVGILSTLGRRKNGEGRIKPQTCRRGRKKVSLPGDFINQLFEEGLGAKAITTRLKVEREIRVSYKTVQRALK